MIRAPFVLAVAFASAALSSVAQSVPAAPASYQLPEAKRVKLPNGLVLLLLEKHELPLTSVTLALRTGALLDPAGKPGVSAITAELLRKGTTTESSEQVSTAIDFIGMQFASSGAESEGTSLAADFLAKDTDKALGLMADVALHPVFPEEELKKTIAQRKERLKTEKDDLQGTASRYFLATLYAGHPYSYGLQATGATLDTITRQDITAFYQRVYTPPNAVIAVVGDFKAAEMESRLRTLFGGWKGVAPEPVKVPVQRPVTGRHVLVVDKPDATQSYFVIGNVGLSEVDPDRAPAHVVNTLFGGRFSSMFNEELRIKSGFSYGASSRFTELRTPGPFVMATFTRNATTGPAIDRSFEVLDRLHTHPFGEGDLTSAKNYLRGNFPPTLETSPALARRLAMDEVDGISRAEFNGELAREQATTLAEANRVIDKDFPLRENYVLVIVGKASEVGPLAAKYGTVTTKKITDPAY